MSDYSQITFFTPKDSLSTGNPNKIIYGADVDAEFSAISTAIATKADVDGDAIGAGTPATEINVDNLKLDGNKITSTDTDGDIELEPNGTGTVVITNVDVAAGEIDGTVIGAATPAAGSFTTGQFGTSLNVDGTVTADGLTVDGASAGTVTAATFTNTTSASGTRVQAVLQNVGSACNVNLVSERVGANFGADFIVETSDTVDGTDRQRLRIAETGDISFYEDTGTTAKLFWDASAEALGIGTTSPTADLSVGSTVTSSGDIHLRTTKTAATITPSNTDAGGLDIGVGWVSGGQGPMTFTIGSSEAMRIDSSGNLLVGKSVTTFNTTGFLYEAGAAVEVTRSGNRVMRLNRTTNDGSILEFNKDGSPVGSIGSYVTGPSIFIGSGNTGVLFADASDSVHPWNPATNSGNDNVLDLGALTQRWDDVYATNGTIQTSDANEKQDIAELDEAERRVAVAAKGLLRKFRWKSAVAEKGDDARIHFGIIAQDLQAAFEAEGLDAGRYAMFIHSTWTDEETGEERSRMGVRYSELLAFIIAAL